DEGNEDYGPGGPGHHGNQHFYDEFEAKGKLGYPVSDMIRLPGKTINPSTDFADSLWVRYFDHGVSVVNATGLEQTVSASELAAHDPVSGSSYYRFRGGQDPVFNNGEEVTDADPLILWGDIAWSSWVTNQEVFGDGTMLFREPDTLVTPIIVDNNVNNQTSPGSEPIQHLGAWNLTSAGGKYYAFYNNRNYGPFQPYGHAWSNAGSGENVALYIPTIGLNGYYEVSEWHGQLGSSYANATNVPVNIQYAGGRDTTVNVDQSVNMAQWNSLGIFPFLTGLSGRVQVSNHANGYVMADAIKFEFVRGMTPEEEDSLGSVGSTAMLTDITSSTLGDTQEGTSACCFADINNDGRPDLYLSRYCGEGSTDLCYINVDGSQFSEEGTARGVADLDDGSQGACWGDLDNDGNFDLVNGTTLKLPENEGDHNDVYRNDGNGYFSDVTAPCIASTPMKTRSVLVFDMDNDQYLDIFSIPGFQGTNGAPPWSHPNEVYHNEMAFAFSKLGAADCGDLEDAPACHGGTATDFDNDGDLDIFAANQTGDLNVLINDGYGSFTRIADITSIGITSAIPQAGTGITMGDVDNDGDLDMLLVSDSPASKAALYFNDGDGTFSIGPQSWNDINGYMGGFADLDNDMDLDLIFAGYLYSLLNNGNGSFDPGSIIPYSYPSPGDARSIAFADIDNDGDPDFVVTDIVSRARLIRNDFSNGNHYLKVKVIAPNGQAGGFGAKVYLYPANQAGGQLLGFREIRSNNGFCGQDDPVVHFGLGDYTAADVVVIYQDGTQQTRTFSSVDQTVEMDGRDEGRWVVRE
ncbi:VCBS repeat-containing protein, partial [bacterium]|nr:VCBS repeat-containing protein [bacterium]